VHYPSDVLAGMALGAAAGIVTTRVMPRRSWAPARGRPASAWAPPLPDGDGLTVVVNAASGSGARLGTHQDLPALLRAELPLAKIVEVGPHDDLDAALDDAASARVLGAAGGDGTINAAAVRALARGVPLAVFPAGTLNHFAADLGLMSVADTIRAVQEGSAVAVDVGRVDGLGAGNDRFGGVFLNTASLGGYPDMVAIRERFEKRFGRWPAMVVALTWVLRHEPPIDIEIDGVRRRLWLVFVGNGIYRPPGFAPTYRSRLDEGLLDVRLIDGAAPLARSRLVAAVLTGQLRRSRVYEQRAATRVMIAAGQDEPLPFACDGEVTDGVRRIAVTTSGARLVIYRPR
jgi:undecaprenyl-diphosphatase